MTPKEKRQHLYIRVLEAAEQHGQDSEPDHEVGDLQEVVDALLDMLPDEKLDQVETTLKERELEGWGLGLTKFFGTIRIWDDTVSDEPLEATVPYKIEINDASIRVIVGYDEEGEAPNFLIERVAKGVRVICHPHEGDPTVGVTMYDAVGEARPITRVENVGGKLLAEEEG